MIVVDASVALKWLLPEPGADAAAELLRTEPDLRAPALILEEVANVLATKVRRGELPAAQAVERLESLQDMFPALVPAETLALPALELACALSHPATDCFYAALARALDCDLVTDDPRFIAVLARAEATATTAVKYRDVTGR